jgi:glycosyltransferase involved in cell wall biosynthesis
MRILMLIHSLRRGGAERVCLELAAGLMRRGDVVEVAAWVDIDEYPESDYQCINRHYLIPHSDYRWVWSIPRSTTRLCSLVNVFRPDLIVIHTPNIAWLTAWARLRLPCVHVLHGYGDITYSGSIKASIYKILARLAHKQLKAKLISVSTSMRPVAAQYFGISEGIVDYITNGVNLSTFASVKKQPSLPPRILMIGTVCPNKGQLLGVEAFRLLLEVHEDATLLIVGDGIDLPRVHDLVKVYNLFDKVKLLGSRSDVSVLLSSSHVLWQLSKSEAMPMVVLEAMATGIPVVGFDVRGTCDAVINGETGHLVPYGDIDAIAQSTISLLSNKQEWYTFSDQSNSRAQTNHGLNTMIKKYQHIFRKIYSREQTA